jgi:Carboxypeptidase regulatory-like domain
MISIIARRIVCACLLVLLGAGITVAQIATSSLRGTVTDPKGSSVPGAEVTLTSAERGVTLTAKTDRDGQYQFLEVRPGTYTLEVAAPGFSKIRQNNLILLVATPARSDFQMTLATGATTVEVTAALQTINTSDATIGNAFNQTQLTALPFEGRDPAGILSLQPGVVTVADRGKVDTNGDSRGGAVNGARSDQTNLTLDGIDNNDQVQGNAFVGALRTTLDSIEEFRVTTTNSDAESGRSSGAQVSLVTKSGSNQIHGGAYEYNRPTNLVANEYFNKHAQLQNGENNIPPRLLRNTFGGSFGGAIKKDRLFYFLAYEGQRTRESFQVSRVVPSAALRDGVIQYQCDVTDPNILTDCPGGQVTGLSGKSYTVPAPVLQSDGTYVAYNGLNPTQIATMDPNCSSTGTGLQTGTCNPSAGLQPGVDPFVIKTMNMYPLPNSDNVGDGFNYRGYTFSAPTPSKLDTYVAKFDYNLTSSGSQRLFVRLGLQNDHGVPTSVPGDQVGTNSGAPQFPGQPASVVETNNSKGIVTGYTWVISPTKVNSFHYGFIRQGIGENGASVQNFVVLRGLDTPVSDNRTTSKIVPVHNFTDDFSWSRGRHTISFGGNYRMVTNERNSNANSFTRALTNAAFLIPTGIAGTGQSFDPAHFGFPAVDSGFSNSYDFPMMALSGVVNEIDTVYVQNKGGQLLASPDNPGAFVPRNFRDNETEFYVQDSWHAKSNLTFTYGLRYSLLQPPYERGGNQVSPSISLDNFFKTRMKDMTEGLSFAPNFDMVLSGPANGKPGFWGWDYKNFAPRLSMAYSPNQSTGLLGSLFGGPGKSSIRIGAGMYYDHFGQGTVDIYDQNGSFGFVSNTTQPPGFVNLDTGPRYTGLHDFSNLQSMIFPAPATLGFPQTPPPAFGIYWSLDDKMKTPYSYALDFSVTRELRNGFTLEVAYVGRISRRLLQEKDLAQPINLTDPKNGVTYFQAITAMAKIYRQNGSNGLYTNTFNPSMLPANIQQYFTDMMVQPLQPGGAYQLGIGLSAGQSGCRNPNQPLPASTTNPIVALYDLFCEGSLNETTPLSVLDTTGIPDANLNTDPNCGADGHPACIDYFPKNGPFTFYQAQYASLNAWTTSGRANYNAMQVMLRKRATRGLTFDFNYTFSKSIDMGSAAERVSTFQGSFFGLTAIYNPFSPGLFRSVSDFDMTHQINANWVYDLPFGRKQRWGANWNRALDAVLGGWSWSGLYKWTTGLPFGVQNGFQFPTNWDLNGYANLVGPKPTTGAFNSPSGNINMFKDPQAAIAAFDYPFPGQVGARNVLRGPGYFTVDTAVRKTWNITERQSLTFSAEAFNLTNSVRFDTFSALPEIDISGSFGNYTHTLNGPRVMEFALRYSF